MNKVERKKFTEDMKVKVKNRSGEPMEVNVTNIQYLGEGTSSVAYRVEVEAWENRGKERMIMKHFYPDPLKEEFDIRDPEQRRGAHRMPMIMGLFDHFVKAYDLQKKLSAQTETAHYVVEPRFDTLPSRDKDGNVIFDEDVFVFYGEDFGSDLQMEQGFDFAVNGSIERKLSIVSKIARAVERLHSSGVIYMDLKPENILLYADDRIKLLDFDAAVEVSDIRNQTSIRFDGGHFSPPELKGLRVQDFERSKDVYIRKEVDVYAVGALLFYSLTGEYPDSISPEDRERFLKDWFQKKYRGRFNQASQDVLKSIFQSTLGEFGRMSSEMLTQQLDELLKTYSEDVSEEAERMSKHSVVVAELLNRYPLYQYIQDRPSGKVLNIVLAGESDISEEFFKSLFSCVQMWDVGLRFYVFKKDVESYTAELFKRMPALLRGSEVFICGEKKVCTDTRSEDENQMLFDRPLAEIYFEPLEKPTIFDLKNGLKKYFPDFSETSPSTYFFAGENTEEYYRLVGELLQELPTDRPIFIGYGSERGDGIELYSIDAENENITLAPFVLHGRKDQRERKFQLDIFKQAFRVHLYFSRRFNERKPFREVRMEFENSPYAIDSSMRSVLSIPYKFAALGLEKEENRVERYYDLLFGENKDEELLRRLMYLEHRSWNAFMIVQGYRPPTERELEEFFYTGKLKHVNKVKKLHPLIVDSSFHEGLKLSKLKPKRWKEEKTNSSSIRGKYDALDLTSLRLHQLAWKKMEKEKIREQIPQKFNDIRGWLEEREDKESLFAQISYLETLTHQMVEEEKPIFEAWEKQRRELENSLKGHLNADIPGTIQKICEWMSLVQFRNERHDFKASDLDILEAIPLILGEGIRCVYKPVAETLWENVMSTLIIEPEQLVLLYDSNETSDKEIFEIEEKIQKFLKTSRGFETEVLCMSYEDFQLRGVWNKYDVIDVTGSGMSLYTKILRFCQSEEIDESIEDVEPSFSRDVSVLEFKNGRLETVSGRSHREKYYRVKKTLTVHETMELFQAKMITRTNPLLKLSDLHRFLWKAFIFGTEREWSSFVRLMSWISFKRRIHLSDKAEDPIELTEEHGDWVKKIGEEEFRQYYFKDFLDSLKSKNLIESYTMPSQGTRMAICTRYPDIFGIIREWYEKFHDQRGKLKLILREEDYNPQTSRHEETYYIQCIQRNVNIKKVDFLKHFSNGEEKETAEQYWKHCKAVLKRLAEYGQVENVYGEVEHKILELQDPEREDLISFHWQRDEFPDFFEKEGNALELHAYCVIKENINADDVRMNVEFYWEQDEVFTQVIKNEIDIVLTKDLRTYFISCKQCETKPEHLHEIKNLSNLFGISPTAIMLTSKEEPAYGRFERIKQRSKLMNVFYLGRTEIGDNGKDIKRGKMADYIQKILDGDFDWKYVYGKDVEKKSE